MSLSFTFVDLLVVGVVLVSAVYAGYRGLVSETLSIFAWAAAAFATLWFGPAVTPFARGMVSSPILASVVAYAIVFLAVLIPLSFLSFRFSAQVQRSQVGTLDRVLGGAFGVVRGLAIIGFAYLILASFVKFENQPESVRTARTLPLMQASTEVIMSLVPNRHPSIAPNDTPGETKVSGPPPAQTGPETPTQTTAATSGTAIDITPRPKPGTAPVKSPKKPKKSYGAADRHALDTLIETTGGNSTP